MWNPGHIIEAIGDKYVRVKYELYCLEVRTLVVK
jgi:hypothetical protein